MIFKLGRSMTSPLFGQVDRKHVASKMTTEAPCTVALKTDSFLTEDPKIECGFTQEIGEISTDWTLMRPLNRSM